MSIGFMLNLRRGRLVPAGVCCPRPREMGTTLGLGGGSTTSFGYFALTLTFCFAWQRPLVVGGALMALAVLLRACRLLRRMRHADVYAALISAGGDAQQFCLLIFSCKHRSGE